MTQTRSSPVPFGRGLPQKLLKAALTGRIKIFVSADLLLEFSEVLQRPHLAARLTATGETAEGIVNRFRNAFQTAMPLPLLVPEDLRDPDDVHVLACALAADADLIVSGDKDLLVLGSFQGIPIVKAAKAVEMLPKQW